jgi:hypothetical protein
MIDTLTFKRFFVFDQKFFRVNCHSFAPYQKVNHKQKGNHRHPQKGFYTHIATLHRIVNRGCGTITRSAYLTLMHCKPQDVQGLEHPPRTVGLIVCETHWQPCRIADLGRYNYLLRQRKKRFVREVLNRAFCYLF